MRSPLQLSMAMLSLAMLAAALVHAQANPPTPSLTPVEQRMAENVDANNAADLALLQQLVETNSGTMHLAGVLAIKDILTPRWKNRGSVSSGFPWTP
jgi:glutamate carboxypeptidase